MQGYQHGQGPAVTPDRDMLIGMIDGLAVQVILSSANMSVATMRDICHAFIGEAIARD